MNALRRILGARSLSWILVLAASAGALPGAPSWLGTRSASAGTEEFSTFDVMAQEEDDESLLDHFMSRRPREWRDEWERAPQAILPDALTGLSLEAGCDPLVIDQVVVAVQQQRRRDKGRAT